MFDVPSILSVPSVPIPLTYSTPGPDHDFDSSPYFSHNQQVIYLSLHEHGMPIIFDTGASMSVSPIREDFIGDLKKGVKRGDQGHQ
jgi:hypothetical protein